MPTLQHIFLVKLIPPLLGAAALILTATLDYLHRDKRTTRFRRGRTYLFAILGLLLLATPVSVYLDEKAQESSALALKTQLLRVRTDAEEHMRKKTVEIENLNKRLADLLTGGDACALAVVSPLKELSGALVGYNLYIEHGAGEALLYDLDITVYEIHMPKGMVFFNEVYHAEVPILTAQTGDLKLGDGSINGFGNAGELGIRIRQRNGTLHQIIKLLVKDNDYLIAEKAIFITNDGRERVVREKMPPEFRAVGRDVWHFGNFEIGRSSGLSSH